MAKTEYAIMPLADYAGACDAVREKLGTTEKIKSGDLAEKIRKIEGESVPAYDGPYEATAKVAEKVRLETKHKKMLDDVTVNKIPVQAVENGAGGYTITVGP